jgi:hypothetical protein
MPALAEDTLRVPENLPIFKEFQRELVAHLTELIEMTRRYPVEIEFKGLRFVFDSEADIRATIAQIEALIQKQPAAAR